MKNGVAPWSCLPEELQLGGELSRRRRQARSAIAAWFHCVETTPESVNMRAEERCSRSLARKPLAM
jgi:hypothetical protein